MNRIVLGGTGQLLRHVPIGVPSSATYILEDLVYPDEQPADRVIGSGSTTAAAWSLTTTATAGPTEAHAGRVYVDATAGPSLGDPALLVGPDGSRELLEVAALSTDSYLEAASSLAGVYPSGSTVRGVLLTAPVPDDFAADEDRFQLAHPIRITWVYTLDGVVRRVPELVDWVRHNVAGDQLVGEALLWIAKAYPDARERLPDHGELDPIAVLLAEEVANDLRARRIAPERFLVGDRGRALLCARILAHLGELGWSPGETDAAAWAAATMRRYEAKLDSLTIGEPGLVTAETSRSHDTAPTTPNTTYRSILMKM